MSSDSVLGSVQQKTSRLKGKKRREGREEGERRKLKKCEERKRERERERRNKALAPDSV